MVKWEYAEITCNTGAGILGADPVYAYQIENGEMKRLKGFKGQFNILRALNTMGDQGWELVSVLRRTGEDVWYLKRPKAE